MNRRGFLGTMVGVIAAPAVVRAENLMKLWVPRDPATWVGIDLASTPDVAAVWSRALYSDTYRKSLGAWFAATVDQLMYVHLCSYPAPGLGAQRKEVPRGCEIEVQEGRAHEDRARDRAEEGKTTTGRNSGDEFALRRERRRVLTLGTSAKKSDSPASVGLFLP